MHTQRLAMKIVNHVLDMARTGMVKRQSINDECDTFAKNLLDKLVAEVGAFCTCGDLLEKKREEGWFFCFNCQKTFKLMFIP